VTDKTQPKLGPHDFEILRVVGQGAFGKVGLDQLIRMVGWSAWFA
jgi:hypothetical protein